MPGSASGSEVRIAGDGDADAAAALASCSADASEYCSEPSLQSGKGFPHTALAPQLMYAL